MASEVDQQIERAREVMARIAAGQDGRAGAPPRRRADRRRDTATRRFVMIVAANLAILLAAGIIGWVTPIGMGGAILMLGLMVAVTLALAFAPAQRVPTEKSLREVDLKVLPAQTERWLESQRDALPAAARPVVDAIGARLGTLSPQLGEVGGSTDTAFEIRRLVGEQLPAFVADYARVPEPLRAVERNGRTPDSELIAGLRLIEQEIAEMTERLAQSDLDSLQTRGRYLEIKYRDQQSAD